MKGYFAKQLIKINLRDVEVIVYPLSAVNIKCLFNLSKNDILGRIYVPGGFFDNKQRKFRRLLLKHYLHVEH